MHEHHILYDQPINKISCQVGEVDNMLHGQMASIGGRNAIILNYQGMNPEISLARLSRLWT